MRAARTLNQLLIFAASMLLVLTSPAFGQEVKWLRSAEQAAVQAAKTGKPILVYVRSASCHYCDLMQQNVWENPTIAEHIMRNFVPLKLTREENAEAVKALDIKGFPSTFVFAADRKFIDRVDGYLEPERFLATMHKLSVASREGAENQLQR
jgi:thioredoxin-related protein